MKVVKINSPIVTKKRFSEMTGLTEETVRGMIEKGLLPTMKIGRRRLVNVEAVTQSAIEAAEVETDE